MRNIGIPIHISKARTLGMGLCVGEHVANPIECGYFGGTEGISGMTYDIHSPRRRFRVTSSRKKYLEPPSASLSRDHHLRFDILLVLQALPMYGSPEKALSKTEKAILQPRISHQQNDCCLCQTPSSASFSPCGPKASRELRSYTLPQER